MDKNLRLLSEFIEAASSAENENTLEQKIEACRALIGSGGVDPELVSLSEKIFELGKKFVTVRSSAASELEKLTLEERIELEQVEKIIDENRLTYHFQPIVSAADGSIYSYEALMRPIGAPLISPYHILKYAALTNRLADIERATFLNVLNYIDKELSRFMGRMVFINSIPNIVLPVKDKETIEELLIKHADTAVIEMTEQAELDESRIEAIKSHYHTLNVRIAIDDYGTGYSNVKNLLDYMPNYVKIDRSLLSEIQNSSKKRHFVRDIIDFCHDNSILALAEGVETSEELRTVILLGVDLIQGYYTARPSAEVIEKISDEVIAEILRYRDELSDGIASKQYVAEAGERVQLDPLVREGVSAVLVGKGFPEGAEVTVCGSPSSDTPVSIICATGFKGTLTIDSVRLLSLRQRPCISLSEGCDVTLRIVGENRLVSGGIQVPFRSRLEIIGNGALYIKLDSSEYFGIGNDLSSKHGDIVFSHNSMMTIDAYGQRGVAIGSGNGGNIEINSGKYLIKLQGSYSVGVGAFAKPVNLTVQNCDLQTKISAAKSAALGSLYSSANIHLTGASFRSYLTGLTAVAMGTPDGESSKVLVDNCNVTIEISADELTAVGALSGDSEISITKASFNVTATGHKALAFGGMEDKTSFSSVNADVSVDLITELDAFTFAPPESAGAARSP